jgi:tRNA-dihydrouridine synthase 1
MASNPSSGLEIASPRQITMEPPQAEENNVTPKKLHGRAFYESIGSPKHIIAPMVDQSEFVCSWLHLKQEGRRVD